MHRLRRDEAEARAYQGCKVEDVSDDGGSITVPGEISLDLTGKKPGRGAYVCKNPECFELARKARRFERSLSCKIPDGVFEQLKEELDSLTME